MPTPASLANLRPPWTPETRPPGGRPKGTRSKVEQTLIDATDAFLSGDEDHPAYDFAGWLRNLAESADPADKAIVARWVAKFVPDKIDASVSVTSRVQLIQAAMSLPQELVDPVLAYFRAMPMAREVEVQQIENEAEVRVIVNGNGAEPHE